MVEKWRRKAAQPISALLGHKLGLSTCLMVEDDEQEPHVMPTHALGHVQAHEALLVLIFAPKFEDKIISEF